MGMQTFAVAGGFSPAGDGFLGITQKATFDKGKEYDNQTSKLMGFVGVQCSSNLPSIWGEIESTQHLDIHHVMMTHQMATWVCQEGTELNPGFYFDNMLIKVWKALKFHPGDIYAQAPTAERGISPLAC